MTARMPAWMIVVIVALLVAAALFGLFVYSLTLSLGQGRPVEPVQILAMALPVLIVGACAGSAWALWRAERRTLAAVLVWTPIPLFLLYFYELAF